MYIYAIKSLSGLECVYVYITESAYMEFYIRYPLEAMVNLGLVHVTCRKRWLIFLICYNGSEPSLRG